MFNIILKELREDKGLTRKEVAKHLDIHESTYGKYELGHLKPSLEMIEKVADFFDVSIDYLIGRTEQVTTDKLTPNNNNLTNTNTEELLLTEIKKMLGREPTEEELKKILDISKVFFDIKE